MWQAIIAGVEALNKMSEKAKDSKVGKAIESYKELEKNVGGSSIKEGGSGGTSSLTSPMKLNPMAPGSLGWDNKFYGHYLPKHFKKTSIIDTKGRVR